MRTPFRKLGFWSYRNTGEFFPKKKITALFAKPVLKMENIENLLLAAQKIENIIYVCTLSKGFTLKT